MKSILRKVKINNWKNQRAVFAIIAFAIIGSILLFATKAATPFASIEPEQGSGLTAIADPSASGGAYVQFGSGCIGVAIQPTDNIQAKIDANAAGTTFCFAPGVYRLNSFITPKAGNILIGSGGTVLNGSRQISSFGRSGSWWTITGQTQEFVPFTSSNDSNFNCQNSTYTGCHLLEAVFRDDVPLFQVTSLSQLGPGKFYFDNAADTVYLGDDPTGRKIEVAVAPGAIRGPQQNVTVRGFIVEKFGASKSPVWMQAAVQPDVGWTVENNEIRLNSLAGAAIPEKGTLRNNNIHHNGQYGFIGGPADTSLIENNEIAHNNTAGHGENWDAGGSKIIRSKNITLRGNYVHDNKGPGLWADWENYNVIYENNRVENNTGIGIFHEANALGIIRNNTLKNNASNMIGKSIYWGADIYLHDSKDTEIYGNTIVTNSNPIGLSDADRGSTIYGVLEVRNVYVHDNTITIRAGQQMGLVGRPTAFSANNRFQNNTYYIPDLNGSYWVWQDLKAKSQWQAIGHDTAGTFSQY